ncbi:MAG: phosphoribosyltransferase [Caldilineaceae bacterium]
MSAMHNAAGTASPRASRRPLRNRTEAGQKLAQALIEYMDHLDVLVLGLPRGGVPLAYEIAKALHAPLDVFIVRKLGAPDHEELAMGALASGGMRVLNADVIDELEIPDAWIDIVVSKEQKELDRRARAYRGERPPLNVRNKTILLVDDGIATGATMRVAIAALRQQQPAKIIVAVGVAPVEICELLANEADELVCVLTPEPFWSVGAWFEDFTETSDEEVRRLLAQAAKNLAAFHQPSGGKR